MKRKRIWILIAVLLIVAVLGLDALVQLKTRFITRFIPSISQTSLNESSLDDFVLGVEMSDGTSLQAVPEPPRFNAQPQSYATARQDAEPRWQPEVAEHSDFRQSESPKPVGPSLLGGQPVFDGQPELVGQSQFDRQPVSDLGPTPIPPPSDRFGVTATLDNNPMRNAPGANLRFAGSQPANKLPQGVVLAADSRVQGRVYPAPLPPTLPQENPTAPLPPDQSPNSEKIDLRKGAAYTIRIARNSDSGQSHQVAQMMVFDGRSRHVVQQATVHPPDALTIYAESLSIDHLEDGLRIECEGTVSVLAPQSLIRGRGLVYSDGKFRIEDAEVMTADAMLTCGESTFEFPIGAIRIEPVTGYLKVDRPLAKQSEEREEPAIDGATIGGATIDDAPPFEPVDSSQASEPQDTPNRFGGDFLPPSEPPSFVDPELPASESVSPAPSLIE